jgi:uncharacterized membrane protein
MTNSPLGQYAPLVATLSALGIIGAYLAALVFGPAIGVTDANIQSLQGLAFVAVGAVFGSAVSVNGWKQPLAAVHKRLDEAGIPAAGDVNTPTSPTPSS